MAKHNNAAITYPVFHPIDLAQLTFVVTGGAGFIGSHLAGYLLQHGAREVRVLDNLITGSYLNTSLFANYPNYKFIEGNICDWGTCLAACQGADYVLHQAALGSVPRSVKNPMLTDYTNTNGFLNVAEAARLSGVRRMVYASSSSVYGSELQLPKRENKIGVPLSPYAVSKRANEMYAQVLGSLHQWELIGLRYFNIFGPRQSPEGEYAAVIPLFINGLLHQKPVYINGDGKQTRDFTYIENAVQANIKAIFAPKEAANKVYNIAVGERCSVIEMYTQIAQLVGSNQQPIFRDTRQGDIRDSLADISQAQSLLGYTPTVLFNEGIARTVQYWRAKMELA